MAKAKKVPEKAPEKVQATVEEVREVSLEEVLGVLINAVNNQTTLLEELVKRIPPRTKLS